MLRRLASGLARAALHSPRGMSSSSCDASASFLSRLADPTLLRTDCLVAGAWTGGSAARIHVHNPATGAATCAESPSLNVSLTPRSTSHSPLSVPRRAVGQRAQPGRRRGGRGGGRRGGGAARLGRAAPFSPRSHPAQVVRFAVASLPTSRTKQRRRTIRGESTHLSSDACSLAGTR